jgi:hypothetical protein
MAMFDVGYRELQIGDSVTCLDGVRRVITHTLIANLNDGTWVDTLVFGDGSQLLPFNLIPLGNNSDWRYAVNAQDHLVPEIVRYPPDSAQVLVALTREEQS